MENNNYSKFEPYRWGFTKMIFYGKDSATQYNSQILHSIRIDT